jgi:hypothetical protein
MPGHHHHLPQTDARGTEGPRGGRDVRRQRTIALAQPTMGADLEEVRAGGAAVLLFVRARVLRRN